MDHSIPVLLAAIGIVAGFMIASIFAYLTFRLDDTNTITHLNLMRLGLVFVVIFSVFFSFSMDWYRGIGYGDIQFNWGNIDCYGIIHFV